VANLVDKHPGEAVWITTCMNNYLAMIRCPGLLPNIISIPVEAFSKNHRRCIDAFKANNPKKLFPNYVQVADSGGKTTWISNK
jgi:hypothetical protein